MYRAEGLFGEFASVARCRTAGSRFGQNDAKAYGAEGEDEHDVNERHVFLLDQSAEQDELRGGGSPNSELEDQVNTLDDEKRPHNLTPTQMKSTRMQKDLSKPQAARGSKPRAPPSHERNVHYDPRIKEKIITPVRDDQGTRALPSATQRQSRLVSPFTNVSVLNQPTFPRRKLVHYRAPRNLDPMRALEAAINRASQQLVIHDILQNLDRESSLSQDQSSDINGGYRTFMQQHSLRVDNHLAE